MSWLQKLLLEDDEDEIIPVHQAELYTNNIKDETLLNSDTTNDSNHRSQKGIGEVTRAQVVDSNHLRSRQKVVEQEERLDVQVLDQETVDVVAPKENSSNLNIDTDIWKTVAEAADIYEVTPLVMSKYIKSTLAEDGMLEEEMIKIIPEDKNTKRKLTKFYHIELVIAAGFRVKGERGKQFRRIATDIMTKNYLG